MGVAKYLHTGVQGKKILEAGYVYAPYIPVQITPFVGVHIPQVRGKAIYDDRIKKIKHDMGYEVEPDRYERFPPLTFDMEYEPVWPDEETK